MYYTIQHDTYLKRDVYKFNFKVNFEPNYK